MCCNNNDSSWLWITLVLIVVLVCCGSGYSCGNGCVHNGCDCC